MAVFPDGGFVVVWEQGGQIVGSAHDRDGELRLSRFQVAPARRNIRPVDLSIAVGSNGGWMVVWQEDTLPFGGSKVFGRWFASDGKPGAPALPLASEPWDDDEVHPRVAARPDVQRGGYVGAAAAGAFLRFAGARGRRREKIHLLRPRILVHQQC